MDNTLFSEVLTLVIAYLFGSIPVGLFISWIYKLPDPRTLGSETIGATNMLRIGDKKAAILTLALDVLKGSFAVLIAYLLSPPMAQLACILAVIGHIWPVWLGLRGGKGIATAFGAILILSWPLAIICLVTWISMAYVFRYSSLASITAVVLSPLYTAVLSGDNLVLTCIVLAGLILWTHRSNIKRLLTEKEPKIGEATPSQPSGND